MALPVKIVVGPRLTVDRNAVFLLLNELAADNLKYFKDRALKSEYHQRIADCCTEIAYSVELISELVPIVQAAAQKCDYDEKTPGNGFRSLICMCDMATMHLVSVLRDCLDKCNEPSFRVPTVCKDLENYVAILRFLVLAFQQVGLLIDSLDEGSLFPSLEGDYSVHDGFFKGLESLDASCFYGRSFGFQFVPSVTLIFNVIGMFLSTYSLSWGSTAAFSSLLNSSRYLLSPEQRAKQIIKVTREANIEFCRGFWNLSELPSPRLFCPPLDVYQVTTIPMCGPLTLESKTPGELISVPEPSAHGPSAPIPIRILSSKHREGLSSKNQREPLSSNLVIHCHGGGYVATTSKSHESYLRIWAKYLDCIIVSIDYSLSPEFPFPRPTEEVLYAYAWILKHPEKFGWNGKKLVMTGDSAGGNLIVSFTLKMIELNALRLPDGLVPIYTPFLFQYLPAPSRVLSFADPLLHMGVVIRCAAAYTGVCTDGIEEGVSRCENVINKLVGHKSMTEYVDEIKSNRLKNAAEKMSVNDAKESLTDETEQDKEVQTSDDATVHIGQDSSHISLSACNYNHSLFNYLKTHPLTMKSTFLNGECQFVEDVFESNEMLCEFAMDNGGQFKYKTRCIAQRITLAGDEPPVSKETKPSISRSVVRSVTSSMSSAFESLAHYIGSNSFPIGHDDRAKLVHSSKVGYREAAMDERLKAEKGLKSVLVELMKLDLPRDHLISPMYTSDEILKQLPPVHFIALHLDPLLDDTITFAKKLRSAGGRISSVDLLHGLPHGFLNFALISDDCYEGARICMRRIEEALNSK